MPNETEVFAGTPADDPIFRRVFDAAALFADFCHVASAPTHIRISFGELTAEFPNVHSAVVVPIHVAEQLSKILDATLITHREELAKRAEAASEASSNV